MRFLVFFLAVAPFVFAADPAVTQSQPLLKAHKYDEAIALLEKAHTANPKSAEISKALADAHLADADSMMADDSLPPNRKYPSALREYRKVLALDKTNRRPKPTWIRLKEFTSPWDVPFPSKERL